MAAGRITGEMAWWAKITRRPPKDLMMAPLEDDSV
jgi:hypothetical protein